MAEHLARNSAKRKQLQPKGRAEAFLQAEISSQHHANRGSSQRSHCVPGPRGSPHTWKHHMPEFHLRKRWTNISVWLSHALIKIKDTLVRDKKVFLPLRGELCSLFLSVSDVCVCTCLRGVMHEGVQCGVGALRVTKSNLLWSNRSQCLPSHVSGRALRSARAHRPSHTHTHTPTHLSHSRTHTHLSYTSRTRTHPPSSRHPARPLTIGQVPEPSASPSRLKGPFGKAGDRGKRSWCYLHAGSMDLWCRGLGRQRGSTSPSKMLLFRVCTGAPD